MSSDQKEQDGGAGTSGDLFLSYSRADTEAVLSIQRLLQARGISTFLDRDQLEVGMPWPQALESGLNSARGVAVFIGPSGLGLWQKREMGFALDRQVQEERASRAFPVIPILLPGADITPGFLFLNTWTDLRPDLTDPDALDALARAVHGEKTAVAEEALSGLCPYRGLRPFREEDAAFFFGREAFSDRLLEAILGRNMVAVIGPSGSGKSSVVQAGVMPKLRRLHRPSSWDAAAFIPGDRPFHNMAVALSTYLTPDLSEVDRLTAAKKLGDRLREGGIGLEDVVTTLLRKSGGTERLLLVVDQFEELYTQAPEPIRDAFLKTLLTGLDRSPLTLVLTLRGSFYDKVIASNRDLSDRLENGAINLGPMTRDELERAIVQPAARVGLSFEPGLAGRMLDDVGESPGNLPLLEFALTELWARRQARQLTHAAYEEIGQVAGAIAQRAESIFKKFTPEQQAITRRVFTRLVWTPDTPEAGNTARQRAIVAQLGEGILPVVNALVDGRLLVMARRGPSQEETIEVAHEALIRQWTRLRNWLLEDQEFLLWRQRLQTDLADWLRTHRDQGTLLRGMPLDDAERWIAQRKDDLTPEEQAFIHGGLPKGFEIPK